jgi:tRNA-binding EMAP/Myf-like protein
MKLLNELANMEGNSAEGMTLRFEEEEEEEEEEEVVLVVDDEECEIKYFSVRAPDKRNFEKDPNMLSF